MLILHRQLFYVLSWGMWVWLLIGDVGVIINHSIFNLELYMILRKRLCIVLQYVSYPKFIETFGKSNSRLYLVPGPWFNIKMTSKQQK